MDNKTVTWNGTCNDNKQANKKIIRHWAQGATITPLENSLQQKKKYIYIYIYTYIYTYTYIQTHTYIYYTHTYIYTYTYITIKKIKLQDMKPKDINNKYYQQNISKVCI